MSAPVLSDGDGAEAAGVFFEGKDLKVLLRLHPSSRLLVVTFTGRSARPPSETGFGESFFNKRGVSAIHFISKDNHWWQTAEVVDAIAKLKAAGLLDKAERLILYGSSMGGYAVLRHSAAFRPDLVLAVSPQFSIDARVVPFEQRWRHYAAKIRFEHDDMDAGLDRQAPISVIVDPYFPPDCQHVELLEALRPVDRVPIAFAGHNTARALEEMGLVTGMLERLVDGRFEMAGFRRDYRRVRTQSCLFWHGLTEALVGRGSSGWAVIAATLAAEMVRKGARMRDHTLKRDIFHTALDLACEAGDADLAGRWLAEIETLERGHAATALARAKAASLGDPKAFLAAAEAAREHARHDPDNVALVTAAMLKAGQVDRALRFTSIWTERIGKAPMMQFAVASALAAAGAPDARIALERLIKIDPRHVEGRLLLAESLRADGRIEAAQRAAAPLARGTLADPALFERLYRVLKGVGQQEAATAARIRFRRAADAQTRLVRSLDALAAGGVAASLPAVLAAVRRSPAPART